MINTSNRLLTDEFCKMFQTDLSIPFTESGLIPWPPISYSGHPGSSQPKSNPSFHILSFLQEDFVKTLPGMERRINEHIVSFHFPAVPDGCTDFPVSGGGSLAQSNPAEAAATAAEMSAIRSSFGHRVPAAADVFDAVPGRRRIVNSESFHGVVGTTGPSQGGNSRA